MGEWDRPEWGRDFTQRTRALRDSRSFVSTSMYMLARSRCLRPDSLATRSPPATLVPLRALRPNLRGRTRTFISHRPARSASSSPRRHRRKGAYLAELELAHGRVLSSVRAPPRTLAPGEARSVFSLYASAAATTPSRSERPSLTACHGRVRALMHAAAGVPRPLLTSRPTSSRPRSCSLGPSASPGRLVPRALRACEGWRPRPRNEYSHAPLSSTPIPSHSRATMPSRRLVSFRSRRRRLIRG